MNIIYKIKFLDRIEQNIKPYFYIGSKTNCTFVDGFIIEKGGKRYYGSSRYKGYKDLIKESKIEIEILHVCSDDEIIGEVEYNFHMANNVVKSLEYFNLSTNNKSNFCEPGYGTYKHKDDYNKKIRLPVNDPLVLDGTYVGATKGYIVTDETRKKLREANSGENNAFYGKRHTDETKAKIGKINTGRIKSDETRNKLSKALKGRKFTEEHKNNMGVKGLITLKNKNTTEIVRIKAEMKYLYDQSVWINPYKLKSILGELRTGYSNLKNVNTGEFIRVDRENLDKYDRSIWISPQSYAKLIKGK